MFRRRFAVVAASSAMPCAVLDRLRRGGAACGDGVRSKAACVLPRRNDGGLGFAATVWRPGWSSSSRGLSRSWMSWSDCIEIFRPPFVGTTGDAVVGLRAGEPQWMGLRGRWPAEDAWDPALEWEPLGESGTSESRGAPPARIALDRLGAAPSGLRDRCVVWGVQSTDPSRANWRPLSSKRSMRLSTDRLPARPVGLRSRDARPVGLRSRDARRTGESSLHSPDLRGSVGEQRDAPRPRVSIASAGWAPPDAARWTRFWALASKDSLRRSPRAVGESSTTTPLRDRDAAGAVDDPWTAAGGASARRSPVDLWFLRCPDTAEPMLRPSPGAGGPETAGPRRPTPRKREALLRGWAARKHFTH